MLHIPTHEQTNYHLTLVAVPADTLDLPLTYPFNQYTQKQIQSLIQHLLHTLQPITQQLDTPLSSFTILTNQQKP
ncbi:condensation domain-containing protein, partial [Bacillus pumilus]|uniref:condensation domain-containing protein n=1 Tax=Bacillus pumilus TaxID=1408 RepID=UPI0028CB3C49